METNDLYASEGEFPRTADFNFVVFVYQETAYVVGKAAFQFDATRAFTLPARRFHRRLQIHLKIEKIAYCLREELRLTETSGCANGHDGFIFFANQRGAQCMRRQLVGTKLVGMAGDQVESGHSIVQNNPGAVDDDTAAEALVHALDKRSPIAKSIRSCDIRGVISGIACFVR